MPTLLYLHGFASSPGAAKARALRLALYEEIADGDLRPVRRAPRPQGLRDRAHTIACDTAETEHDLIALYRRRGYDEVERVQWDGVNYRSVILAKRLSS